MVWLGREVRSRTDYILGTYRHLFRDMSVWYPRHNSDNYIMLGCLHRATLRERIKYVERRTRIPLWPLPIPTREDRLLTSLQQEILKPKSREVWKN